MSDQLFRNYNPASPVRDHTEEVIVVTQGVPSPEALARIEKASKGELKAKLAAILDRGVISDRLQVDLPPDIHGEWVRNDPLEIGRLKALGFQVDDTYASKRAIHSDGSDSAIVGDVIHMICPKEVKEIIDEIRHEQIIKTHAKKTVNGKDINKEESDLAASVLKEGDSSVRTFSNSQERAATADSLREILGDIDSQIKPGS